nr:MAG TPA: hypothetical protein [Microviridae sp.]
MRTLQGSGGDNNFMILQNSIDLAKLMWHS